MAKSTGLEGAMKKLKKREEEKQNSKLQSRYNNFLDVLHKIQMGYSEDEIRMYLVEKYDFSDVYINEIIQASRAAFDFRVQQYAEKIAERNINALTAILETAYEKGDLSNATKAIDILNKMSGLYTENINLHSDTPIFQINVGN